MPREINLSTQPRIYSHICLCVHIVSYFLHRIKLDTRGNSDFSSDLALCRWQVELAEGRDEVVVGFLVVG